MGLDALARGKDPDEAFGGGGNMFGGMGGFGGSAGGSGGQQSAFSQKDAEKMFKSMVSALSLYQLSTVRTAAYDFLVISYSSAT